jgi:predicted enzyme related to lactoylglutathione lyase
MLKVSRIILFANDLPRLASFYEDVLGLDVIVSDDPGWREFDAGGIRIALHKGGRPERAPCAPKIVFQCEDVARLRKALNARGAKFGKVKVAGDLLLCDGKDPEGNALQLSNRP